MQPIGQLDKLAADLSWDTYRLFLEIVEEKHKNRDYDADDSIKWLVDELLKARLESMFRRRLETPLGPVHSVDEVLTQLIADIRAIQEEFIGSDEVFISVFIILVQRLRPEMLEIVRIHELSRNGALDPNLHQRAASRFRKMFFAQLMLFLSFEVL